MVVGKIAQGAAVDAAITEIKDLTFTGTLGACYKKRGAAGADDTSLYAQKAIEFKYSEFVEPADGGDGGKGGDDDHSDHEGHDHDHDGEDSAFAYSMAGVVLATAALAF